MDAGLRLIAERLAVPAALLFAADVGGALRVVSALGTRGDARALQALAETLAAGGDATDGIEGARFAAAARLGDGEGVLLVLAPEARTRGDDWNQAFAACAQVSLGLVRSVAHDGSALTRVLHEVAVHPGTFDERLALALVRLADALGLDGAVFAQTGGDTWAPETVFDPSERLVPTRPVPLGETFCAFTTQSDGPFAVQDAQASPLPVAVPACYLGAPVFAGGRCVGTLSAVGHAPRARPFGEDDRALVEALARWVGSAVGGRETARRLAAREAALSAFFDAAPMGMGIARLVRADAGPDVVILTINAAGAAILGMEADGVPGRRASEVGLGGRAGDGWLHACRAALDTGVPQSFETDVDGRDGRRTLAVTVARVASDHGDARFTFVVEDATERRRAAEQVREREAQIEALVSQAPVALFASDRAGRLSMSRGRGLDLLGLSIEHALGRPVADLFAQAPDAASGIEAALAGGAGAWTVEAGDRTFRVQALPRRDADGRPAGLIGVALDTTDPVEPGHRADLSSRARSALLKHLDHEIRSPLTSILGYADLLSEHTPPHEVAEVRDVIERSGERLLGALDDLLDLTLLDDENIPLHPTPVDPCALVAEVAESGRAAAEARRLSLALRCTLSHAPILIDARLFERVVRHLVSGAIASAPGPRVDVSLHEAGPDGMELRVLGGVPPDTMGVGMELVRRLVRAMGGTSQEVAGEAGGWVVRLPRQRVPVVDLGEPARPVRHLPARVGR